MKRWLASQTQVAFTQLYHTQTLAKVEVVIVLGVSFTDTTSFVNKTASILYALKTFEAHGLCDQALYEITQAVLVAQLLYASPA